MDQHIYDQNFGNYGAYATRRYPKGRGLPGVPPTSPFDPNANPVPITLSYGASLQPHGATERWSYIVPPRRRMRIQSAHVHVIREQIGGVLPVQAYIQIIRAGQTLVPTIAGVGFADGNVGAHVEQLHTGEIELFEGDEVKGTTSDFNAGAATCFHNVHLVGIEYDLQHSVAGNFQGGGYGAGPNLYRPQPATTPTQVVLQGTPPRMDITRGYDPRGYRY